MLEIINQALVKNKDFNWLSQAVGAFVLKKEAAHTQRLLLPPLLTHSLKEYHQAGGERDEFILKWTLKGLNNLTLSCVDPRLREDLLTTKALIIIEDYSLDDIADKFQDAELLNQVLQGIHHHGNPHPAKKIPNRYGRFCLELWQVIRRRTATYPRFAEFQKLFERYYQLFFDTLNYSLAINQNPKLLEVVDFDAHQEKSSHNMNGLIVFAIDLMGSPDFDHRELKLMERAVGNAQLMGRIGNSITTWERELPDRDFTSDVFVWAVKNGVVTVDEMTTGNAATVATKIRRSGVYEAMFARWKAHRQKIVELIPKVKSVDLGKYLNGLHQLFFMHLASRGLK